MIKIIENFLFMGHCLLSWLLQKISFVFLQLLLIEFFWISFWIPFTLNSTSSNTQSINFYLSHHLSLVITKFLNKSCINVFALSVVTDIAILIAAFIQIYLIPFCRSLFYGKRPFFLNLL